MAGQLGQTKRSKSRGKKGLHNKNPEKYHKKNPGPPPEKKVREIVVEMMPSEDFNKEFFKVTNDVENLRGFQWQDGWNRDTNDFNPYISCGPGGLYFTDILNLDNFIKSDSFWVRVVHPNLEKNEFARIKGLPVKWKAHEVFAEERKSLWVLETWKVLISKAAKSKKTLRGHLTLLDIAIQRSLLCKSLREAFFMDIGINEYVLLLLHSKGSRRDRLEMVHKILPEVRGSLDSKVCGEIREMLTDLEKSFTSFYVPPKCKALWAEIGAWSSMKRTLLGLFKKKEAEVSYKNTHLNYLSGEFNG
jgi:hypothetical protein